MKEITIYEYQLDQIIETLRVVANVHKTDNQKSCFSRMVRRSTKYALNAKSGSIDSPVDYV